jgi:hypothetical protein
MPTALVDTHTPFCENIAMSEDPPKITRLQRKLVHAGTEVSDFGHDRPEYLHAIMCQLGLPRSRQAGRTFERSAGRASMMISAGKRYTRQGWEDLPLPYGSKPRLAMIHLCSEAVRTQSPVIDVSGGIVPFLREMGMSISGRTFRDFKNQMTYLAGCEMQLAWDTGDSIKQTRCAPVHSFEAWSDPFSAQSAFWPDEITLGQQFFETLCAHAVPLDPRAVHALQHSALAMDIYSWLAHRLCRIRTDNGVKLYWKNLRDQFGQEYKNPKDFKKAFAPEMRKVLTVYPSANVRQEHGGIRLFPSPPPIHKTRAVVALPHS